MINNNTIRIIIDISKDFEKNGKHKSCFTIMPTPSSYRTRIDVVRNEEVIVRLEKN